MDAATESSVKNNGSGKMGKTVEFGSNKFEDRQKRMKRLGILLMVSLTIGTIFLCVFLFPAPMIKEYREDVSCTETCSYSLVESIPDNLTYVPDSVMFPTTFSAWKSLILNANESIDMAVFYWSLTSESVDPNMTFPSAKDGEEIFDAIVLRGNSVRIRIAQNSPTDNFPQTESAFLMDNNLAEVKNVNFTRLMNAGVLHTKMILVDGKHFYVGSANMDFRSLTQVKELGVVIGNCPCLASDMQKIFDVYWELGGNDSAIPLQWESDLWTKYNISNPMKIELNNSKELQTYLSSSPPPFCPMGRTNDIDAILQVINKAEKYINIAVMDYMPAIIYGAIEWPWRKRYWPVIDDALRTAALDRGVHVRILASKWKTTKKEMKYFLKSLEDLSSNDTKMTIEVRLFVVPVYTPEQEAIPFSRVNHNKYMVTDNAAYIGTSNWSGDYFIDTGGIGLVVNDTLPEQATPSPPTDAAPSPPSLREQLASIFERDWGSEYSSPLSRFF